MNDVLGMRFSMDRKYSLLHIGNQYGQGTSWLKMRKDVCYQMEQFARQDPLKMLMGTAGGMMGTGGALVGCANWQGCKDHTSQRCQHYGVMGIAGILCVLLQLGSAVCAFVTPNMIKKEAAVKKKKKKFELAKYYTMLTGIGAFVPGFFSVVSWVVLSDMTFKDLAMRASYPYPASFAGAYMAGVGAFALFVGMFQAINRLYPVCGKKEEKEEEEEEGEEYQQQLGDPMGAEVLMPGMEQKPAGGVPGYS